MVVEGFGKLARRLGLTLRRSRERELAVDPEADYLLATEAGVSHVGEAVGQGRDFVVGGRGLRRRRREEQAVLNKPIPLRAEVYLAV